MFIYVINVGSAKEEMRAWLQTSQGEGRQTVLRQRKRNVSQEEIRKMREGEVVEKIGNGGDATSC